MRLTHEMLEKMLADDYAEMDEVGHEEWWEQHGIPYGTVVSLAKQSAEWTENKPFTGDPEQQAQMKLAFAFVVGARFGLLAGELFRG